MTDHTRNRKELLPGIFFNAIRETKFKTNLISLRFVMPLNETTAAKNALIFPVLLRGSEKFPDIGSIRLESKSIYDTDISDTVYKRGDTQIIELRMKVLDDRFSMDGMKITERAVALLLDILLHPLTENGAFLDVYVESEKQMLIEDIRAQMNEKQRYAKLRLTEEMFEGDVYSVSELGTVQTVSEICSVCLWHQYREVLSRARIEIFAVGNFDFDALRETFTSVFSAIERKDVYPTETKPLKAPKDFVKTVYERQNITQGKLVLGFYTGVTVSSPDYHVMQVLNMIYGAGVTSKLFMNVREKLSLCYYCGSGENGQKGYMTVSSGIEFANEKKAVDEILAQLDEIKKGNISENELRDAKLALIDSLERVSDSVGAMLNFYFANVMNGTAESPSEKCARIESVTAEQIAAMAQNICLDTYYFLCGKEENAQ